MVKDSLKKLLNEFPYFFDKSSDSNFYKVQSIFNNQFQGLYQSLFEVYESFKLEKRVFVWKEQSEPYISVMNFVANFPYIKSVEIYKNDNLIYSDEFTYGENKKYFDYSYEYDTRLDGFDGESDESVNNIISKDNFLFIVETYDEYIIRKGFPENDIILGNDFDHDKSLDEIGKLNNIPRKKYIETDDYENTEPPYNDRLSEDDYHYMKRMLNYMIKIHEEPLPVAEIFKLYGLEATLLNRERLLLKMFDINKHGHFSDEDGNVYVDNWKPQLWEHKDGFCKGENDLGAFFFVNVNTVAPKKFSKIYFYFTILNIYGKPVEMDYTVNIYLGDTLVAENWNSSIFQYDTENLNEVEPNIFRFVAVSSEGDFIGEQEIEINVQGCNNGHFYVTANGSDSNDGSKTHPFATLGKALSKVSTNQDLIIIGGTVVLDGLHLAKLPCTIMGCNNGTLVSYRNDNRFLNIVKDNNVTLTDLTLSHNYAVSYCKSEVFENRNGNNNYETVILHGGVPVLVLTPNQNSYYYLYDNVVLDCSLISLNDNPLQNTDLELYLDDELYCILKTNNVGIVNKTIHFENNSTIRHTFKLKFTGSDVFWENEVEALIKFNKNTPRIQRLYGRLYTLSTESNSNLSLYENGLLRHSGILNQGMVSSTYLPDYGEHIVYFSDDGVHVMKEWIIDSRFYISDLGVESLVTDVTIDDDGKLYVTRKNLSEFNTLHDLEDVIVDLSVENDVLFKAHFVASNQDGLNGNELYPEDLINMKQAIVDVTMSDDGELEFERINTIIIEEEES